MIRTVIFDIDNTLYDYDRGNAAGIRAASLYMTETFGWEEARFPALVREMMRTLSKEMGPVSASHNRMIRFQNILERNALPLHPHALKLYHLYWDALLQESAPYPGARETMRALKEKDIRTGIGTDMTAWIQFRKLEQFGLLPFVDFVVSSEEAGAEKPDPAFFSLCLKKAGCLPEECLFVGDSLKKDYDGSAAAGMRSLLFDPPDRASVSRTGQIPDDPGIRKIRALPELLEALPLL